MRIYQKDQGKKVLVVIHLNEVLDDDVGHVVTVGIADFVQAMNSVKVQLSNIDRTVLTTYKLYLDKSKMSKTFKIVL